MISSSCLLLVLLTEVDLKSLSASAYEYGPFFFAILFLFAISRWGYKRYKETLGLPDQTKGRDEAVSTCRKIFFASFSFGVIFTIASIVWWWWHAERPPVYVFEGTISALKSFEEVSSPMIYLKWVGRAQPAGDSEQYRDMKFVVIQNRPFSPRQKFEIDYFKKGERTTQRMWFDYPGDEIKDVSYTIEFDRGSGSNVIKLDNGNVMPQEAAIGATPSLFAAPVVFAQEKATEQADEGRPRSLSSRESALRDPNLAVLADKASLVGEKVSALRAIANKPAGPWLWTGPGEPGLVTLMDLMRYRDDEVAYLAKQYLVKINLSAMIVKLLLAPRTEAVGREVFQHADKDTSQIVLNWVAKSRPALAASLRKSGSPLQLVGTPSPQGDRYYVQARWSAENKKAVDCLTRTFNQALSANRSLQDERVIMQNRTSRLVYWYGKDWAIQIRERIIQCGGDARFTSPVVRTPLRKGE